MFGSEWKDVCIRLSQGYIFDKHDYPPLVDPFTIEPEDADRFSRARGNGEIEIATRQEVKCFHATCGWLTEGLWNGEIASSGITQDGQEQGIPQEAWKDKTGNFKVSFSDSTVTQSEDGTTLIWEVGIGTESLEASLMPVIHEREIALRRARAQASAKGGRPEEFDWAAIDRLILNEYRSSPPPATNTECQRRVEKRLQELGWTYTVDPMIPGDSSLIKRIREIKKLNSIN